MRKVIGGLLAAAMMVSVAACDTGSKQNHKADAGPARDNREVSTAWGISGKYVGQPAVEDGVALAILRGKHRSFQLITVDARTGRQLWARGWSPGNTPIGEVVDAEIFTARSGRDLAVLSEPPPDLTAPSAAMYYEPLVVLDLHTGRQVFETPPQQLNSLPYPCDDDKDACFNADQGGRRLNLRTGRIGADADAPPSDARVIGDAGLFSSGARPGEQIGVRRHGRTLWHRPVTGVFGPGYSSDVGWDFEHDDHKDIYYGFLGKHAPKRILRLARADRAFSAPVRSERMLGLDGRSGRVLWSRRSSEGNCVGFSYRDEDDPQVRCAEGGRWAYPAGKNATGHVVDAAVALQGFDVESGDTTWSVNLSPSGARTVLEGTYPVRTGTSVLVETAAGPRLVNLRNGRTNAVAEDDVFMCTKSVGEIPYATPAFDGDDQSKGPRYRFGGSYVRPCHADGSTKDVPMTADAVRDGGTPAGKDRFVLVTRDGLQGYDLSR